MKSKVVVVSFRNIFCLLVLLCFKLSESAPTFGDEFVHIKVHLPTEGETHGPPILAHSHPHAPIVHAPVSAPHKVVHHYHHRKRKPVKKNPLSKHAGLLESILLSEVKPPISSDHYKYLNHADDIAKHIDSYSAKPIKSKPHLETYTLIEETKPKQSIETFKVIESKVPQHQLHHHDSHDEEGFHYKPKGHTETYKVIEDLFDDYHSHFKDPESSYLPPKKQRVKTVKIVDSHEPDYEQDYSSHFEHRSHSHEPEHDDDHASDDAYHYGSKSHAESVKIVETKAPHKHAQEYSVQFGKRPHSETVEIIKSHTPSKASSYYNKHQYHQHSHDNHGYQYKEASSDAGVGSSQEDAYSGGYEYQQQKQHHDSYRRIPEEPEDTYLPPKHHHSHHHDQHYHSNVRPNSLYDDEPEPTLDTAPPNDPYLPPPLPQVIPGLKLSNGASAVYWPSHDSGYKATDTYSGIDSYSAPHVQGLGSTGYQHPSPYP